jgi:hypothetical protein
MNNLTPEQELEIYNNVNNCETLSDLANVIRNIKTPTGKLVGKTKEMELESMAIKCEDFHPFYANTLTRSYGIRQQAFMIYYYGKD